MTELFAGATSYWLVLAKSGGSAAGAAGGTCCPGGDGGGAASWAAFLGSGDLALAARAVRRRRGCGRSGGLATPDGKICAPCVIRGARAAKAAPSWQDLRAVYSQTAVCRAFRIHGAHILPEPARFRMRGVRILPRTGDFPVRGRFRDAWSAKLATDCRPGTHRGGILPRQGTRERIAREYCHCQSPENAFAKILPWTSAWIRPHQITAALPAKKRRRRQDLENAPVRSTKDRVLARLG